LRKCAQRMGQPISSGLLVETAGSSTRFARSG
jgi:hypothetical protein